MKLALAPSALLALGVALGGCASAPAAAPQCPPAPPCPTTPAPAPAPAGPLIFDQTPEIPAALKARILRYLEARSATVTSIADDGKSLLILTRLGQATQVHRLTMPGGAR